MTSCFPADGTVGTSEARGVSWNKSTGKWEAQLWRGGKRHHLGRFAEERDAIDAVRAATEAATEGRLERHLVELREARASGSHCGHLMLVLNRIYKPNSQ